MRKRHKTIGLGGTFDHFHSGHQKLLLFAAELADRLLIGITDDKMTQHKVGAQQIEPYSQRAKSVRQFCQQQHIQAVIVPLHDSVGPTLENSPVDALAVTPETVPGANKINELRSNLNLRQLPIYICDFFLNQRGQVLHADQIRAGKMSRSGQDWQQILERTLILTQKQRDFFHTPQGELVSTVSRTHAHTLVIVVGDYCLENFIQKKWFYTLGVFDFKQQRQRKESPVLQALSGTT